MYLQQLIKERDGSHDSASVLMCLADVILEISAFPGRCRLTHETSAEGAVSLPAPRHSYSKSMRREYLEHHPSENVESDINSLWTAWKVFHEVSWRVGHSLLRQFACARDVRSFRKHMKGVESWSGRINGRTIASQSSFDGAPSRRSQIPVFLRMTFSLLTYLYIPIICSCQRWACACRRSACACRRSACACRRYPMETVVVSDGLNDFAVIREFF
jgi:hypothetical protein